MMEQLSAQEVVKREQQKRLRKLLPEDEVENLSSERIQQDAPKRRGRPKGSTNQSKPPEPVTPVTPPPTPTVPVSENDRRAAHNNLAYTFSSVHSAIAMALSVPDFALTEQERKELADVYTNFAENHGYIPAVKKLDIAPVIGVTFDIERKKFDALARAQMERKPGKEVRNPPPFVRPQDMAQQQANNQRVRHPTQPVPIRPEVSNDNKGGPEAELNDYLEGRRSLDLG